MACKTLAVAARFPAAALLRLRCSPAHLRLAGFCHHRRGIAMAASSSSTTPRTSAPVSDPLPKGADLFIRSVLSNMQEVYLSRNSTAKTILDIVRSYDGDNICYDHFAFRTFGVDGYGINSLAEFFTDFGYVPREELWFPAKKLRALWFSPPTNDGYSKAGIYGPLPRIFISELLVDELSAESQEIVHKYIKTSGKGNKHAVLASTSGELTWEKPIYSDFQVLSRLAINESVRNSRWRPYNLQHGENTEGLLEFGMEGVVVCTAIGDSVQPQKIYSYFLSLDTSESEYAAWTLVNGYALNHATIATHRLQSDIRSISKFNKFMEDNGFKLNSEGGILKVSPDGLLQQSSTVADSELFKFADGMTKSIPRSYIEFAERLPLPHFKDLRNEEVKEHHRRDGFEVGNADKIFESTSKDQLTRMSG